MRHQPGMKAAIATAMGKGEQCFLVDPEERRLQQCCQLQIIFGKAHHIAKRQQVLDLNLVLQRHPVGARHRNAGLLQRRQQQPVIAPARAQQHHDVSWLHHPARRQGTLADPAGDARCDPCRRQGGGITRLADFRRGKGRRVGRRLLLGNDRPKLDKAAGIPPRRPVVLKFGNPGVGDSGKVRHRAVDQLQNGPCRTEGHVEPDLAPWRAQHVGARCKVDTVASHHRRVRPLKGIDRLLEITDDEQGTRPGLIVIGIRPGLEELVTQPPQKLPLRGTGVLRLVEEHMANAVIELPSNPLGGIAVGEHVVCQPDQIVVIEQPALGLQRAVPLLIGPAECIQRVCQLVTAVRRLCCQHTGQRLLRRLLYDDDIREIGADILVRQVSFGKRGQLVREQRIDKPVDMAAPSVLILAKPGCHPGRTLHLAGNAAFRKRRRDGADSLDIQIAYDPGQHLLRIPLRIEPAVFDKMRAQLLHHIGGCQPLLLLQQLVQNGLGIAFRGLRRDQPDHRHQRRVSRPKKGLARLGLQARLFEFISKFRLRHNTSLDRKPAQHRLAERMHCLHTRAVIIVKNLGKQAARALQHGL